MFGKFENKVYSADDKLKVRFGTIGLGLVGAIATLDGIQEREAFEPKSTAIDLAVTAMGSAGYYVFSKTILGKKAEQ